MMASNSVLRNQFGDARLVPGVADHERRARCHRPIEAGREIIEHHHPLAGVDECMNHVAADIAGAARDQDRHAIGLPKLARDCDSTSHKSVKDPVKA